TGSMYIDRGGEFTEAAMTTAFVRLLGTSKVCQYNRIVTTWTGKRISEANKPCHVIIAIADAMMAYNAAYEKCEILRGNITD
ncbi:hypothetical protein LPJ71_003671, partial [Coemansia sp. S17]